MSKILDLIKKYEEVIRYLIIGVLTTVVSLIVYYGCTLTFLDPKDALQLQIANIISWIISVAFAYVTNRVFVFKSKSKDILKEVISFTGARVVTLLMDMAIMFIFVTQLNLNDKIFKLVSQVVVIVANYIFSKLFVFKKDNASEK